MPNAKVSNFIKSFWCLPKSGIYIAKIGILNAKNGVKFYEMDPSLSSANIEQDNIWAFNQQKRNWGYQT